MVTKIAFAFIAALVLGSTALATQASARPGYSHGYYMSYGPSYGGSYGNASSAGFGGGR